MHDSSPNPSPRPLHHLTSTAIVLDIFVAWHLRLPLEVVSVLGWDELGLAVVVVAGGAAGTLLVEQVVVGEVVDVVRGVLAQELEDVQILFPLVQELLVVDGRLLVDQSLIER